MIIDSFYYKQLEFQHRTSEKLLNLFKKLEVTVNFKSTQTRKDLSEDFRVIKLCLQFISTKPGFEIQHTLKNEKIDYDPSSKNTEGKKQNTLNQKIFITNPQDIKGFLIKNLSRFNMENISFAIRKTRFKRVNKNGIKSIQLDFDFQPVKNTHILPTSIFDYASDYNSPQISYKLSFNSNTLSNLMDAFPFLSYIPTLKTKKKPKKKKLKLNLLYNRIHFELLK